MIGLLALWLTMTVGVVVVLHRARQRRLEMEDHWQQRAFAEAMRAAHRKRVMQAINEPPEMT